jgi:hypothetical protein
MNRLLAITLTIAISNLMAGSLIFGAGRSKKQNPQTTRKTELNQTETPDPLFQTPQGASEKQYPPEELEQLRSKLLELVDTVKEYSDLILSENPELTGKLTAVRKQFEQYSPQQLNTARAALNPAEMNARFGEARATLEQFRPLLEATRQQRREESKLQDSPGKLRESTRIQIESAGLPGRDGPDPVCEALVGSTRVTYAVTAAADVIFIAAAGIRAGLSRGCNQVLVVLGEGGNTSAACIAADVVYFVAVALRAKLLACDVDYTERTVDASFSRLEHLHTDLENSVANDNTNKTAIVNNDNTNKTAIINNDNTNTTTITGNDNSNKTTILAAITASQIAVNANTDAGKNELRNLILRTQIEANLAEDHDDAVGLYMTPGANGGYLELARAIVIDTIAKLGGKHTVDANKQLAQGDAQNASGNFFKAYSFYRQAYRTAVKQD